MDLALAPSSVVVTSESGSKTEDRKSHKNLCLFCFGMLTDLGAFAREVSVVGITFLFWVMLLSKRCRLLLADRH